MRSIMLRLVLFLLLILYLLSGPCFSAEIETQAELSPWEKLETSDTKIILTFVENFEPGGKGRYTLWPKWKPTAPMVIAGDYLVNLTEIKNQLEKVGIKEKVTIEITTMGFYDEHRLPLELMLRAGINLRSSFLLVAQLGTFKPEIKQKENGEGECVVFPIPPTTNVPISMGMLEHIKKYRMENNMPPDVKERCVMVLRNWANEIKARVYVYCSFPFEKLRIEVKRIRRYIVLGKYDKAEAFCEGLEKEMREKGFAIVADAYLEKGNYEKAAQCYEKTGDKSRARGFNRLGNAYLAHNNYVKAAECFGKGEVADTRARSYGVIADFYKNTGEPGKAKTFYDKAIWDYESMIKDIRFTWNDLDNDDRRRCINQRDTLKKDSKEIEQENRLETILNGSAAYCKKLLSASFKFICVEMITERVENAFENRVVYFYRLTKKGSDVKEERSLKKRGGRKIIRVAQKPDVEGYTIERIVFGPNALLGKKWQVHFDYRIIGEEILEGQKTVIIDVIPKAPPGKNPFFGQAWVKEDDFSVVKISWNPKSIEGRRQHFQKYILERAGKYNGEPRIVSILELNVEKRGLRFPGRCFIEEAYITPKGEKIVRVRKTTRYKKYYFYSVESEVTKEKMK